MCIYRLKFVLVSLKMVDNLTFFSISYNGFRRLRLWNCIKGKNIKKIRGFYQDTMIKVITGIRRCGNLFFLKQLLKN